MRKKHIKRSILLLLVLLLLVTLLSLCWGSYTISFSDMCDVLRGGGDRLQRIAVFSLRLPRLAIALLVGSALAASGSILQTITRNDLADPGIIGINAGASLAAVLYLFSQDSFLHGTLNNFSVFVLPVIAMLGALITSFLIFLLSSRHTIRPNRLLLSGIGVSIAIQAMITFLSFRANNADYQRMLVWTNGSLWGSSWIYVVAIVPVVVGSLILIFYRHKTLDVLCLGEPIAIGVGVSVKKQQRLLLFLAVILAGAATAVAGNISFLGLLGPSLAKRMVGTRHKVLLPTAMLIAMIIIVFADTLARNLFSPLELPVGIVISLVGVPYFIYLMIKEEKSL